MPEGTYQKGIAGEQRALEYLQNRGMVLLCRRYRSPVGEIDLVMLDGDMLVFVEVKARGTGRQGAGLLAVDARKQRKLRKTALVFLSEQGYDGAARFDVIELTADGIVHVPDAFQGNEF